MNTGKVVKTKGIVLSEVSFSESDKMLTVLTPDLGKISCVAKGARRMQSTMLSSSQIFAFSEFVLFRSKGDTYYINSAELIESFYSIRNDYDRLNCAMDCMRFVKKNANENETSTLMLKLVLNTIYLISVGNKNMDFVKVVFELKAVQILGYAPDVGICKVCKDSNSQITGFSMKNEGFICDNCKNIDKSIFILSPPAVAAIRFVMRSELGKIFSFSVSDEVVKEIEKFNNIYIQAKLN